MLQTTNKFGVKRTMKKLIKLLTIVAVLVATLCCLSACSTWENEYVKLQEQGYDVTVRFDTTGGKVSGTADTYIVDVYTTQGKETNSDGKVEIKLYSPDSELQKCKSPRTTTLLSAGTHIVS